MRNTKDKSVRALFLIFVSVAFTLAGERTSRAQSAAASSRSADNVIEHALLDLGEGTIEEITRRQAHNRFRPLPLAVRLQFASEVRDLRNFKRLDLAEKTPDIAARLASGVTPILRLHGRADTMEIVIFKTDAPIIAGYADSCLVLSTGIINLLTDDELLAVVGHELGHGWFIEEYAEAANPHDEGKIKVVEFKCDAISVLSMMLLKRDPSALLTALSKIDSRLKSLYGDDYLKKCKGDAHPALSERSRFYYLFLRQIRDYNPAGNLQLTSIPRQLK